MTPASVSSLDTSSQQPQLDTSTSKLEPKTEVKHEDEEEDSDTGSCSKGGKLSNHKTEEKPLKFELNNEECSGDGGKGVPMDTSTPTSGVKMEDKKPEVKKEVKEEETSEVAVPQAPVKRKSKAYFSTSFVASNIFFYWLKIHFFWLSAHIDPVTVFKPEELRQALMPTLESLYRQDPESLPFRMPVDPKLLCIPVRIVNEADVLHSFCDN